MFCMPRYKSQIAPKKPQCPRCLMVYRVVEVNLIAREVPGHPHRVTFNQTIVID